MEHRAQRARRTVSSDADEPRVELNQQYDDVMRLGSLASRASPGDMMVHEPGERDATGKCEQRGVRGLETGASQKVKP